MHVLSEHLAQRLVEQMRPRVVRHGREARRPRDASQHAVAGGEALAAEEKRLVPAEPVRIDEVGLRSRVVVELDRATVRHLPTARGIERRLAELRQEVAFAEVLERADLREHVRLRVADELGLEVGGLREVRGPLGLARSRRTRDLAVSAHLLAVAVDVDRLASLFGELDGELEGEAVGRGEA